MSETDFFNRLKSYRNILFLCHRNADCDSIGSAYALASVFNSTIGAIESTNRVAQTLLDALEAKVEINPDPARFEFTVVIDTATKELLSEPFPHKYAVIDHHEFSELTSQAEFYLQKHVDATAELVYDLLKHNQVRISKKIALALITGIVTDTGHFKHAKPESFRKVAEILEQSGLRFGEVLDVLANLPADISARIAVLKAAKRMSVVRLNENLIATSEVSAYRDAAASALVVIGADIAFVGSKEEGETRISLRAKREAVERGMNLALIAKTVSEKYGGNSGGHEGAAGLSVKAELEDVTRECVAEARRTLTELEKKKTNS